MPHAREEGRLSSWLTRKKNATHRVVPFLNTFDREVREKIRRLALSQETPNEVTPTNQKATLCHSCSSGMERAEDSSVDFSFDFLVVLAQYF